MKNNLFILLVLLLFSSCHKEYRMEYMNGRDEKVREETFRFESDTVAYLKAYEEFCIAKKVEKEMIKKYGGNEEIISFKLYNEKGELITGEGIKDIKAKEEKIENQINEINN